MSLLLFVPSYESDVLSVSPKLSDYMKKKKNGDKIGDAVVQCVWLKTR